MTGAGFLLGTHRPDWLARLEVLLLVSHRTLGGRWRLPRARAWWALDSGGFTELRLHGAWRTSEAAYVEAVARYRAEVGRLAWAALDLAVSVAGGLPWLDYFPCPTSGPVLLFLGEGGERAMVRRVEAIATAKDADLDQLGERLRLCFRAPRLAAPGAGQELAAVQAELQAHPAVLVMLDPLYLAAAGASGSSLYDMGAVLQAVQGVCQQAGCALLVVTHWNKTGDGKALTASAALARPPGPG